MTDGISYIDDSPRTEPRPTIKPIIVPQLIDFHPLLIIWRRHHQGHVRPNPSHCPRRAADRREHAELLRSRCSPSAEIRFDPTSVVQISFQRWARDKCTVIRVRVQPKRRCVGTLQRWHGASGRYCADHRLFEAEYAGLSCGYSRWYLRVALEASGGGVVCGC